MFPEPTTECAWRHKTARKIACGFMSCPYLPCVVRLHGCLQSNAPMYGYNIDNGIFLIRGHDSERTTATINVAVVRS